MALIGDSRSATPTTPTTPNDDGGSTPPKPDTPPAEMHNNAHATQSRAVVDPPAVGGAAGGTAPMSKQRLSAYKNFARTANRTLTTFTNEMSEILRQSVERLDCISMKVRGCVYEIEKQRVAKPPLEDIFEGNEHEQPSAVEKFKALIDERIARQIQAPHAPPLPPPPPKELTVGVAMLEHSGTETAESTCGRLPTTKIMETPLMRESELKLVEDKENIVEAVGPPPPPVAPPPKPQNVKIKKAASTKLSRQITTSKKAANNEEAGTGKIDEREVIQRINHQHKLSKRRGGGSKDGSKSPRGDKPAKKAERKRRKRDATAPKVTTAKTQQAPAVVARKSSRQSTSSNAHKSVTSNKSMHLAVPRASTTTKMEMKNTKLARKFASSNFHDTSSLGGGRDSAPHVDGYTGGRVVRLLSDSRQDWSVIMHTQKAPNRFELRQPSPQPILDEITLKDLEPLKAEYPRRDHIFDHMQRLEETPLFKLVNGSAASMECLIDVACNVRKGQPSVAGVKKRSSTPITPVVNPPAVDVPSALQVTRLQASSKHVQAHVMNAIIQAQGKGDASASLPRKHLHPSMAHAGINRAQESHTSNATRPPRKPTLNVKASVVEQSKRIALKLAEIRNERSAHAHTTEHIYKQGGEKDAKRRLKKYIGNPGKTHQKYMVMMVYDIVYDNNACYHSATQTTPPVTNVANFLAKYIYLEQEAAPAIKPQTEYTVAIMITSSEAGHAPHQPTPANTAPMKSFMAEQCRSYAISSREVKPTRDIDARFKPSPPHHNVYRMGDSPTISTLPSGSSAPTPRSTATAPGLMTRNGGEAAASWKNAIRSCYYQQPPNASNAHASQKQHAPIAATTTSKPMDSLQVKGIISNMELQLKQVLNNPHIENKAIVIKGLQEQMEWILSTLEGQTSALRKRKEIKRPDNKNNVRRPQDKREPILKPLDAGARHKILAPASAPPATTGPAPSPGVSLKKVTATMTIPTDDDPISEDFQNQLMSKWQSLEHPSIESVNNDDTDEPTTTAKEADTLSVSSHHETICVEAASPGTSRPETRRDLQESPQVGINQEKYHSQYEGSYLRDAKKPPGGAKGRKRVLVNDHLFDEILSKLQHDENRMLDEESESFFNSCCTEVDDAPVKEGGNRPPDRIVEDHGDRLAVGLGLTPEEIVQFQENIKILENQLGAETQRFVDEMDEVIKEIHASEPGTAETSKEMLRQAIANFHLIDGPADSCEPIVASTPMGKTGIPSRGQGQSRVPSRGPSRGASRPPSRPSSRPSSRKASRIPSRAASRRQSRNTSRESRGSSVAESQDSSQMNPSTGPYEDPEGLYSHASNGVYVDADVQSAEPSGHSNLSDNQSGGGLSSGGCPSAEPIATSSKDFQASECLSINNASTDTTTEEMKTLGYITTIGYITHKASVTSMCSEVVHVAEEVDSIEIGQPFRPPVTKDKLNVEVADRCTECELAKPNLLTPTEISLTLSHEMHRHIRKTDSYRETSTKETHTEKRRDYDLTATGSASPMMEDIRRSLFREPREQQAALPPATSSSMVTTATRKKSKPLCFNPTQRNFNRMPWEMTDKSTATLSLTNLDDYVIVEERAEQEDAAKPVTERVSGATNTSSVVDLARKSRSEIALHVVKADFSEEKIGRVAHMVESAISARVSRFFENTGIGAMSESVENILSATLAATLANQNALLANQSAANKHAPLTKTTPIETARANTKAVTLAKRAVTRKASVCSTVRDFGALLMLVYSAMFAIMFGCLSWSPRCMTG